MAISALFPGEMRSLRGFAWRIRSPWAANGLVPPRRLSDAPKINGTSALAEGKGTDSTVCKSEIGLPPAGVAANSMAGFVQVGKKSDIRKENVQLPG